MKTYHSRLLEGIQNRNKQREYLEDTSYADRWAFAEEIRRDMNYYNISLLKLAR